MVWWPFATKPERADTLEVIDLHSGAPLLYSTPADRSLAQMLESGEIDALVTARTPSTFRRGSTEGRRLFEHPFGGERGYFRRTGIFPIMHTLVVKKEILEVNPWVAFTLFKAFSEAKDLAMADLTQTSALPLSLPFLVEHAYQTMDSQARMARSPRPSRKGRHCGDERAWPSVLHM